MAERRPKSRKRVLWRGKGVYTDGSQSFPCTIRNWTETGAQIAVRGTPMIPRQFYLLNLTSRTAHDAVVIWNDGRALGLELASSHLIDETTDRKILELKKLFV